MRLHAVHALLETKTISCKHATQAPPWSNANTMAVATTADTAIGTKQLAHNQP
jgi:hypothetical protein